MTTLTLVLTAVGSVLLLLFLVMKARMHAFLALMVVSMGAGLFSGMPLDKIAATMEKGMGGHPRLPGGGCRPGSYVWQDLT
ncbi:hypothetical protein ACLK2F_19320 [Escherichia coli]